MYLTDALRHCPWIWRHGTGTEATCVCPRGSCCLCSAASGVVSPWTCLRLCVSELESRGREPCISCSKPSSSLLKIAAEAERPLLPQRLTHHLIKTVFRLHARPGGDRYSPGGFIPVCPGLSVARFSLTASRIFLAPSNLQPCCCSAQLRSSGASWRRRSRHRRWRNNPARVPAPFSFLYIYFLLNNM